MGSEFLAKTKKSAKKYLDRSRADLCRADLFKVGPETVDRQFLAKTEGKADLHPGDRLQVEAEGPGIILRHAGRVVGRNARPNPGLKRVVADAGGFFPAAVSSVHAISSTFEFCVGSAAATGQPNG